MSNDNDAVESNNLLGNLMKIAGILALLGLTFSWEQVLSLPLSVYMILFGIFGIWFSIWAFFFFKKHLLIHRDSKQEEYIAVPFLTSSEEFELFRSEWEIHYDLKWLIEFERFDGYLNNIVGPFCPQDNTKMTSRKTFFGRYEYECSTCLLKVKTDYDSGTLENRVRRISEAKLNW